MLEGIVDIGSNSVRMTVYDCDPDTREFQPFFKLKKQISLASRIDAKTGRMTREGIDSLVETIDEYRHAAERFVQMNNFACFATAAVRNSANCQEVLDEVQQRCGVSIELLSGIDEARLGFVGAMWHSGATTGVQIDVGGGSSEVLLYENGLAQGGTSIPLGSLSLFEKYVSGVLPSPEEAQQIHDAVAKRVHKALGAKKVCCASCIGGSARAMRKIRDSWMPPADPGAPVNVSELDQILARVAKKPKQACRDLLREVPERIHTFTPGLLAIQAIAQNFEVEQLVVHDSGIREGYLLNRILGFQIPSEEAEEGRKN